MAKNGKDAPNILGTDGAGNPVHATLTDHEGNITHDDRKVTRKDGYGRDVFDGQVSAKDAHGVEVFHEPWVGKGPKAGPTNIHGV